MIDEATKLKVEMWSELAHRYLDQFLRTGLVSREWQERFVMQWIDLRLYYNQDKSDGKTIDYADDYVTSATLQKLYYHYRNPKHWWWTHFSLSWFIAPRLKEFWGQYKGYGPSDPLPDMQRG